MSSQISENFLSSEFKELSFEDGGLYCGGTRRGKAHGHGVCTGPGGEGQYSGAWCDGFESSGSYVWPNGNVYYGQWMQGKRHGLGMEKRGHWMYQGDMNGGFMGKYGVKKDEKSLSRYEGTWASGVQCGYGVEVYSDEGSYVGQWLKGSRHGYGIRTSATFENSSTSPQANTSRKFSLTLARSEPELIIKETNHEANVPPSITDLFPPAPRQTIRDKNHTNVKISPVNRIGFFLKGRSKESTVENQNSTSGMPKKLSEALKLGNKSSTSDSTVERTKNSESASEGEKATETPAFGNLLTDIVPGHNASKSIDLTSVAPNAVEIYSGEWKNDKRSGYGVCHRSDGLRYEGEWSDNCKNGFGATTFSDGSREEGCYKNNHFQEPSKRLQVLKIGKIKEQVDSAVMSANKAAQIAAQKAEIALSRAKTAVVKMEQAIQVVDKAMLDSKIAQCQLAAHLEQRKQINVNKVANISSPPPQPPTVNKNLNSHTPSIILNEKTSSTAPGKVNRISKSLINLRRAESWQCMDTPGDPPLHSTGHRKCSDSTFSNFKEAQEEQVADFYASSTYLVTFSEKPDKNEILTNKNRRGTMPSIMKYPGMKPPAEVQVKKHHNFKAFETIMEDPADLDVSHSQLSSFVVQNCRKKLLSSSNTIADIAEYYEEELRWDEYPPVHNQQKLPSYKLQSKQWMSKTDIRSVPDVRYVNKWEAKLLPKKEADNMSRKVRAEKQKLMELQEQLRKRAIVIKIGEVKAWLKKHLVEIVIVSLNAFMIAVFYHLLK